MQSKHGKSFSAEGKDEHAYGWKTHPKHISFPHQRLRMLTGLPKSHRATPMLTGSPKSYQAPLNGQQATQMLISPMEHSSGLLNTPWALPKLSGLAKYSLCHLNYHWMP